MTGGDGFLGNAVVKLLRNSDLEVLSLTRRTPSKSGYKYCDLAVPSSLVDLLKEVAPNCIVNLAATVDFSSGVLPTLYSVNSLCPAILAEYCQRTVSYLIQASSIVAVGGQHTIYGESTQLHPDTDYGCSKLLKKQQLKKQLKRNRFFNLRINTSFFYNVMEHTGLVGCTLAFHILILMH